MYTANMEILSDEPNMAVLRHPGRKFPGVLVQGDTLHALVGQAANLLAMLGPEESGAANELADLKSRLETLLEHYEAVLAAHGLEPPFVR